MGRVHRVVQALARLAGAARFPTFRPMGPSPTPGTHPRARPDVVFRRVGDDWVLFDPEAQQIHVLNLTAALVWSFCTGEHTVEAIEQEVRGAFPDAEDAGVTEALEQFRASGLLAS